MKVRQKYILALCTVFVFTFSQAYGKSKSSGKSNAPSSTERISYPETINSTILQSLSFIDKKDWVQAVSEYSKLEFNSDFFAGYRNSYSSKRNSGPIIELVDQYFADAASRVQEYIEIQDEVKSVEALFGSALQSKDTERIVQAVRDSRETFLKLSAVRNAIADEEQNLRTAHERSISAGSGANEVTYPLLALKYVAGLEGCYGSGILGVIDAQVDSLVTFYTAGIKSIVQDEEKKFTRNVTKANLLVYPADHSSARESLATMKTLCDAMGEVEEFHLFLNGKRPTELYSQAQRLYAAYNFESQLCSQALELLDKTSDFAQKLNFVETAQSPENPEEALRNNTDTYSASLVQAAAFFSDTGKAATAAKNLAWFTAYNSYDSKYQIWNDSKTTFLLICNELVNAATVNATKTWIKIANGFVATGNTMVQQNQELYNQYLEKLSTPQYVYSNIDTFISALSQDIGILEQCDSYLDEGYAYRSNFTTQRREFSSSISQLETLIETSRTLKQTAQKNHNDAVVAKNQVDLYYNRATANFNAGDYSSAHTNLDRANDTYNSVIENLKKDVEVQEQCYQSLLALRQDFIEREKPILISEVRRYKTDAKNSYYAGDFDQANALLTRAENRRAEWAKLMDTTLDSDDELQRLKEMVNTALSIKEGRVIYPEDPLYPEMSQLLSIANMYYQQALTEDKAGRKTQSRELLEKSREKLNELKLVYPRNQEASILSLRIDKLLDPTAFDTMFREKYAALKKINYASRDALALESYNDLLDLYQINPNYSGLKSYINSVEIDLGIRPKPVAAPDLSQAKILAQEAKTILDSAGRDEAKLNQARDKANQALTIDSNNSLAIQVLDEIALRSGGEAAVILSAADEEKYQSAVRDLQTGNVFSAKQKVDELLLVPNNARSAKILKLQKRIEASL